MGHTDKSGMSIPAPLRGSEEGTWAQSTIQERLPKIAQRVLDENSLYQDAHIAICDLITEIPSANIRPIHDPSALDQEDWKEYTQPYLHLDWRQVPWFFAEHYFYRRIIEGVGYYKSGNGHGLDPFSHQKHLGLMTTQDDIRSLSSNLTTWLKPDFPTHSALELLFAEALWGNQADLSLWPVGKGKKPGHSNAGQAESYLLVNDMQTTIDRLNSAIGSAPTVDVLLDNAGFELVVDLCLTDYLLSRGVAAIVRLHAKAHPTFVSDATREDVSHTLAFFQTSDHRELAALGNRLREHIDSERLVLFSDFFWTSPLCMWEMPSQLCELFTESQLVISKGDANYRRLLGDRHWPFTTPFNEIMSYFPAPLLALRTLKAELASGLSAEQIDNVSCLDPQWMTNGRWGIVQYAEPQPA